MAVSRCPPEVLGVIFALLDPICDADSPRRDCASGIARADLARCSLVCKAWHIPAQQQLYKQINLVHVAEPFWLLLQTITSRPDLAACVTTLYVGSMNTNIRETKYLLDHLPNLERYSLLHCDSPLRIEPFRLPSQTGASSKLKMLALSGDIDMRPLPCPAGYFATLKSLEILFLSRIQLPSGPLPLTRLRKIVIEDEQEFDIGSLVKCDKVRVLELRQPKWISAGLCEIGVHVRSLLIEDMGFVWDASYSSAFKNLEQLTIRHGWIPLDLLPSTLKRLSLTAFAREKIPGLVKSLSSRNFLPHLQSFPDLQYQHFEWQSYGRPSSTSDKKMHQLALILAKALFARGLTASEVATRSYCQQLFSRDLLTEAASAMALRKILRASRKYVGESDVDGEC